MTTDEYRKALFDTLGYLSCAICGRSNFPEGNAVHHIVFRSKTNKKNKNINDPRNMIFVCGSTHSFGCHGLLATRGDIYERAVRERRLWELFPELEYLK